ERKRERDDPCARERRLAHEEVVRASLDVVVRDAVDRPEAVADEARDRAREQPVEPAQERELARMRGAARSGAGALGRRLGVVGSHQWSIAVDCAERRRLPVEELLEDLERGRSRRGSAVAAVLDQRADDELWIVVRPVPAPPRLAEKARDPVAGIDGLLRRAGLAGDLPR